MEDENWDELKERAESGNYYSFLNVGKQATTEEINNGFRRLSRIYHPDKHRDPLKKQMAETLFNKMKKVHEVLIDEHKRAIYDTLGVKGLETEGWQVVERTKTPREIREEYERLAKEREERDLQQKTNPKGQVTVNVDARDLFESFDEYSTNTIEITNMSISQSIDFPLTLRESLTLGGNLRNEHGRGSGGITGVFKRTTGEHHWIELDAGVGSGLRCGAKGNISWPNYKSFGSISASGHLVDGGFSPGLQLMIAKHFDKHLVGYLSWRLGKHSSVTTSAVYSDDRNYIYVGIQLGIPHSLVQLTYVRKFQENEAKCKISLKLRSVGGQFEYGYEQRVTKHSIISANVLADLPLGVSLRLKLNRGNQQYVCNIHLSQALQPSAIFYGSVVPLLVYQSVKYLIVLPYQKRQKQREVEELRETNMEKIAENRRIARAAVELMKETYERVIEIEESKSGLIVIKAWYGKGVDVEHIENDVTNTRDQRKMIDVTVALQCQVKNSQLILYDTPRSSLPGFYDPSPGEKKSLRVLYKFRNQAHDVCVGEEQPLRIPKQAHKVATR